MTKKEQHNHVDRLIRRSFEKPIPADTREVLQKELRTVRNTWQTKTEACDSRFAVFGMHPGMTRLAAAACLLLVLLGGMHLALNRPAKKEAIRPMSSYACIAVHHPVSFARCTAVFYSKEDPTVWVERRMIALDQQGNVTKLIATNRKGARA